MLKRLLSVFPMVSAAPRRGRRLLLTIGCAAALLLSPPPESRAGLILSDGSPQGNRDDFTGTVGTRFTVGGADVFIGALGYEDPGGDGLQRAHQVGLWDGAGTLVASAVVPAGVLGVYSDGWEYAPIVSTRLIAGATYSLGAQVFGGFDAWSDSFHGGNGVQTPDFTHSSLIVGATPTNVWTLDSFGVPNRDGGEANLRWAPANALPDLNPLIVAPVPEPSSVVLLGLGASGVALAARNRRRPAAG